MSNAMWFHFTLIKDGIITISQGNISTKLGAEMLMEGDFLESRKISIHMFLNASSEENIHVSKDILDFTVGSIACSRKRM